jgi:2-polyprenyl-3-methyl-5-hydroxy-6-metoxy-1,4-benzoquinol methylase
MAVIHCHLARLGINVTAVIILADLYQRNKRNRRKGGFTGKGLHEDVMQFQAEDKYDLIICMGNSISFFK